LTEYTRPAIGALSKLPDAAAAELAAEGDVFADDKRYAIRITMSSRLMCAP
jgi:hypothetical protein